MEKKCKQLGIIDNTGFEMVNRVYCGGGTSPTVTATDYKHAVKVVKRWRKK